MKQKVYILFTAGRGPIECSLAVNGVQKKFRKFLEITQVEYEVVHLKKGTISGSIETIVFELNCSDSKLVSAWLGTIMWYCQSSVRKRHKRKNWFIKCEQIFIDKKEQVYDQNIITQSFRASGPGGQHRNKVETAIRLIHKETGLIVTATDGKSQHQNKKKARIKLHKAIEERNQTKFQNQKTKHWNSQIEIERGNPIKVFEGSKFAER